MTEHELDKLLQEYGGAAPDCPQTPRTGGGWWC